MPLVAAVNGDLREHRVVARDRARRDPAAVMIHRMCTVFVAVRSWLRPYDQLRNARCWRWQRAQHCTRFDELSPEVREALEAMSATSRAGTRRHYLDPDRLHDHGRRACTPGAVLLRNDDQDFHHVAHAACLDAVTFAVEGDLRACLSKEG
jgi:hypothetical protein